MAEYGKGQQQLSNISRKRAFADMLRKQGQELGQGLGQTQMVSGWAVPNSGMASANAIISQLLGAYMGNKYAGQEQEAKEQQMREMQDWAQALMRTQEEAQFSPVAQQEQQPLMPEMAPQQETGMMSPVAQPPQQQLMPEMAAQGPEQVYAQPLTGNERMAHLLKGGDIGGIAAKIAEAQMADMLGPKDPVSVSRGASLVDPRSGDVVYQSPYEPGTSGGMTGSLQELAAINADRVAAGQEPISAEDYLRERRQNTRDLQLYRTYVAQAMASGETPMSEAQFNAQRAEQEAGAKTTGAGMAQRQLDIPQAWSSRSMMTQNLQRLDNAVEDLYNNDKLKSAIGSGRYTNLVSLPATERRTVEAWITNIKSQIGFMVLQNMRDASKTGGALGQVSELENILLQENLAALDMGMETEEFMKSLVKIRDYLEGAQFRLDHAWKLTYPELDSYGMPRNEGTAPVTEPEPVATQDTGKTVERELPPGSGNIYIFDAETGQNLGLKQ